MFVPSKNSKTSVTVVADKNIPIPKPYPKMSHINNALRYSEVKDIVWTTLGFDKSLVLPSFPNDILYGRLSEMLHDPRYRQILLSDKEDPVYKLFFTTVVNKYELSIEEYSEEEAAAAREAMDKDKDSKL